jgi:hypothetical protein
MRCGQICALWTLPLRQAIPSHMTDLAFAKQPVQCLWCRKNDDVDEYGGRMMLTCDTCLNACIHVECDAVRRGGQPLSKEHVLSGKPWFCSTACQKVRGTISTAAQRAR